MGLRGKWKEKYTDVCKRCCLILSLNQSIVCIAFQVFMSRTPSRCSSLAHCLSCFLSYFVTRLQHLFRLLLLSWSLLRFCGSPPCTCARLEGFYDVITHLPLFKMFLVCVFFNIYFPYSVLREWKYCLLKRYYSLAASLAADLSPPTLFIFSFSTVCFFYLL